MVAKFFAGKYEHEWWTKVEIDEAVDEQWIVSVSRVPKGWSRGSTRTP